MSIFWQWVFAIIGLVAFLMATPPILQLIFGQPKIGLSFYDDDTTGEGKTMKIHLMNIPINNWFLKFIRITRLSAQDIYLAIKIFNVSTKQVVTEFMPEINYSLSSKSERISLPSSLLTASSKVVKWQQSTNSAVIIRGTSLVPLQEGTYVFDIQIGLDSSIKRLKPILLHIGKSENEMYWDKRIAYKLLVL
ncbi:MAG: hypothetical protein PHU23_01950 [Dehalococcoidales bacterium]|nr:hypothetical protein [Dehalococcoidales bacterium]